MKPVIIIAIAVACSVIAVFGISVTSDMFESNSTIEKGVDPYSCQVWVIEPDTNKAIFIDEYNQECLDFISLPLTEQYEIYEQEKPIIKSQIDALCVKVWNESQNESIFEYLVDHTSCLELLCPIDIIDCKITVGEVRLVVDGMKNKSGDIIDMQKFEERDERCWNGFNKELEIKKILGNDAVISIGPTCWYLWDEFAKLGAIK